MRGFISWACHPRAITKVGYRRTGTATRTKTMRAWRLSGAAIALSLCAGMGAAHAGWQDDASPYDVKRFSMLEESKSRGLSEAQSGSDAALIHAVIDPAAVSLSEG